MVLSWVEQHRTARRSLPAVYRHFVIWLVPNRVAQQLRCLAYDFRMTALDPARNLYRYAPEQSQKVNPFVRVSVHRGQ